MLAATTFSWRRLRAEVQCKSDVRSSVGVEIRPLLRPPVRLRFQSVGDRCNQAPTKLTLSTRRAQARPPNLFVASDPEVSDLEPAQNASRRQLVDENIVCLDVAMIDVAAVHEHLIGDRKQTVKAEENPRVKHTAAVLCPSCFGEAII